MSTLPCLVVYELNEVPRAYLTTTFYQDLILRYLSFVKMVFTGILYAPMKVNYILGLLGPQFIEVLVDQITKSIISIKIYLMLHLTLQFGKYLIVAV